jgi:hypothetical protein
MRVTDSRNILLRQGKCIKKRSDLLCQSKTTFIVLGVSPITANENNAFAIQRIPLPGISTPSKNPTDIVAVLVVAKNFKLHDEPPTK